MYVESTEASFNPAVADSATAVLIMDHAIRDYGQYHDPKIDDQAVAILLNSDVFYIGALGSRKTHEKRVDRLRGMGFLNDEISQIFAPIGLHIGAADPREIALSIMAEIVGVYRGVLDFH